MIRSLLIFGACFAILCGCSNDTIKNKPIYEKTAEAKELVSQSQWDKARNEVKEIHHLYEQNKWKYQFIGDSREYNGLDEVISKLQTSIDEKNKLEAKQNIVMIEHYIQSLYFN